MSTLSPLLPHLIDTHCHMNMMLKKEFDRLLTPEEIALARDIISQAQHHQVTKIINVGTSLPESINCVTLAQQYDTCYAAIGIHPNDCTPEWKKDVEQLKIYLKDPRNKVVAIGECGMDFHYPDYDKIRQQDAFKAQIELALTHHLPLIIHTRDAIEETFFCLDQFKDTNLRAVVHCFSEQRDSAQEAIKRGFVLGIGGTLTYPKNHYLRDIVLEIGLEHIILETDAPFLPPQPFRGKQNHPQHISFIAQAVANLLNTSPDEVARVTTKTALMLFNINL